jgi:hypothetical protein
MSSSAGASAPSSDDPKTADAASAADPKSAASSLGEIVDEARSAAGGTRQAAKWMASALAAIPALAVVGNLIKGPGEGGFDALLLFVGVGAAAAGAYLGIYLFSTVLEPVPLKDLDLATFDMANVPGQPFKSYEHLRSNLDKRIGDHARARKRADYAKVYAVRAVEEAVGAEARVARTKADLAANPSDPDLKDLAATAAHDSEAKAFRSGQLAGAAAAAEQEAVTFQHQVEGLERIRAQAFQLKASDEVSSRYARAKHEAIIAVGLVAIGVCLVAIAPKPKSEAATSSLVALHLNPAGKVALGCPGEEDLLAIRIGGPDSAPKVITLPTASCPPKLVDFTIESAPQLGKVDPVKPIPTSPKP